MISLVQFDGDRIVKKKSVRDGRSTCCTLLTLFIIQFKLLYTAYTVACMPIYIDRKVRKQLEWADGFLSKILDK